MRSCLYILVLVLSILLFLTLNHSLVRDRDIVPAVAGRVGVVTIQTANPYRFNVRLEVKCNWDGKSRYLFHQFITVPGKKQILIHVPNNLNFCEIWPKVIF
jgi:hypothetical protein